MDYRETKTDDGALPVLYADAQIAVVDKPAGVMAHDSRLAGGETDLPLTACACSSASPFS